MYSFKMNNEHDEIIMMKTANALLELGDIFDVGRGRKNTKYCDFFLFALGIRFLIK